ncbi:MAG: NAD(P)/FAD-dependent oxidoreductase [Candidatus Bathyarchaeota archaeon]
MSESEEFDVVVVGGGPAGLITAIMCASRHLNVLILERQKVGGLLATLYPQKTIPNYPGFPQGVLAIELVRTWLGHLRFSSTTVKTENTLNIDKDLTVTTNVNKYKPKVVVVATGARPRMLEVPGESKFAQKGGGVHYFPSHPEEFLGKRVLVVGGGDTAIDATIELLNLADELTLVHRREGFRAFDQNVEKVKESGIVNFIMNSTVKSIKGRTHVEKAIIVQKGKQLEKKVDAIIIAVGLIPNTEALTKLELQTNRNGFIITDRAQRTNVEGIFAVGDVTDIGLRLITVAAAHGAIASHHIYSYIKKPYWANS